MPMAGMSAPTSHEITPAQSISFHMLMHAYPSTHANGMHPWPTHLSREMNSFKAWAMHVSVLTFAVVSWTLPEQRPWFHPATYGNAETCKILDVTGPLPRSERCPL
jgi:hypothetical protein